MARTTPQKTSRFVLLASVCVVVAALYFAQEVLIPVALAMLLGFLLAPIVHRLEQWRLGRVPSVLITVIAVFAVIGILGYVVAMQVYDLANNVDQYKGNIASKIETIRPGRDGLFKKLQNAASEVQEKIDQPEKAAATQATQPDDKATNLIAGEVAARTHQPRVLNEKDKNNPAAGGSADAAIPSTQWTKQNPLPVANIQPQTPLQSLARYLGLALGPLGTAGIVVVFVIFMLLQREDLRNRLIRLIGHGQLTVATQALDDASSRISRYLLAQAIVNGTYGIAIAFGLWLIGWTVGQHDPSGVSAFPNVVLWGLLCAVLRFIPYIGPWIGASLPLIISLAVYKGFGVFGATIGMFVVVELISNNFMEPWLYGSSTGMSTIAILVSAVFWTWLWGPIGLLLSTPLTVVLVVLGKYVPQLQFLDVLLGDEPVLDPPARVYQRMLAMDQEEALEFVEEYLREHSLDDVYDDVLLPALALAEQDRHRGLLDDRRQTFIRSSMREIIEELGDQSAIRDDRDAAERVERLARGEPENSEPLAAANGNGHAGAADETTPSAGTRSSRPGLVIPKNCAVHIVCLPAHDEGDEIANLMLTQLLEHRGYCTHLISPNALASEMMQQVEKLDADVITVSALPPAAVGHARYLCKRVQAKFASKSMAVGLWNFRGDLGKARDRITCVASVALVTTLHEMQEQIDQLAQPALLRASTAATESSEHKSVIRSPKSETSTKHD
jgi:predicted PurR-regulated permease PerM